jgi:hypothetical protein
MGPPTIGRLLITAVEILEDARAANRLDRRRARYDPAYKLGHVIGKAASAARIGPPPKLARWLQDVAERVEEYHPEYADESFSRGPGAQGPSPRLKPLSSKTPRFSNAFSAIRLSGSRETAALG